MMEEILVAFKRIENAFGDNVQDDFGRKIREDLMVPMGKSIYKASELELSAVKEERYIKNLLDDLRRIE